MTAFGNSVSRREFIGSSCLLPFGLAACGGQSQPNGGARITDSGKRRIQAAVQKHIDSGYAPGAAGIVSVAGDTFAFSHGFLEFGRERPVQENSIFRITSMTKPLTALATLMLVNDGSVSLREPVGRLLPELAHPQVLRTAQSSVRDVVPAARPITVHDLLTFTLGTGLIIESGHSQLAQSVSSLAGFGMPDPRLPLTPEQWIRNLGELPLLSQPGAAWHYGVGSNVLAVLIARASGKPFDQFMRERIFDPLQMADTGFFVPRDSISRFATAYIQQDGTLAEFDRPDGAFSSKPAFPTGDSGLVSTVRDYQRFAEFLMTGQNRDGRSLLPKTLISEMAKDQLTGAQRSAAQPFLGPAKSWGYGVSVAIGPTPDGLRPGAYGWNGGFGTSWFNDPGNQISAILFTNRLFDSPETPQLHRDFWKAAYSSFERT